MMDSVKSMDPTEHTTRRNIWNEYPSEENYKMDIFMEIHKCIEEVVEMYCVKSNCRKNLEEICDIGWDKIFTSPDYLCNLFHYKLYKKGKYIPEREIQNFLWYCTCEFMLKYKEDINSKVIEKNLTCFV